LNKLAYNGAMGTYSIKPDGTGNFQVVIRDDDEPARVAGTFPSLGEARDWVEEQIRKILHADDLDITQ
jgi:hypothetical protein